MRWTRGWPVSRPVFSLNVVKYGNQCHIFLWLVRHDCECPGRDKTGRRKLFSLHLHSVQAKMICVSIEMKLVFGKMSKLYQTCFGYD